MFIQSRIELEKATEQILWTMVNNLMYTMSGDDLEGLVLVSDDFKGSPGRRFGSRHSKF